MTADIICYRTGLHVTRCRVWHECKAAHLQRLPCALLFLVFLDYSDCVIEMAMP